MVQTHFPRTNKQLQHFLIVVVVVVVVATVIITIITTSRCQHEVEFLLIDIEKLYFCGSFSIPLFIFCSFSYSKVLLTCMYTFLRRKTAKLPSFSHHSLLFSSSFFEKTLTLFRRQKKRTHTYTHIHFNFID